MAIKLKNYEKELYICAKCGYCRDECTIWKVIGFETVSPRGKILLLKHFLEQKKEIPSELINNWYLCCTCGKCADICPLEIDFPELIRTYRIEFAKNMKNIPEPFLKVTENILSTGNPLGRDREDRSDWRPDDLVLNENSENLFYVGCMASYWTMDSAELICRILNKIQFDFNILDEEPCCGFIETWSGEIDKARELAENFARIIQDKGVKTIFTACPGCYSTLKHVYPKMNVNLNVEVLHISELFARLLDEGKLNFTISIDATITYHDPCHLGRFYGIFDAPRRIIRALPGIKFVEMDYNLKDANCCGGPMRTAYLDLAEKIGKLRAQEAADTKADHVTTICPQCLISLRQSAALLNCDYNVIDLIVLIAKALGIKEADDYL
ncbi:MAG: (Fe-S)-binding protein [Candidatus Helarchaeota archaeon]|nr:(Fe-S)-binding protein [Candidatus Helarchaeota archaeon]